MEGMEQDKSECTKDHLMETIDRLRLENSQLKSQFDEAVSISQQFESISSQNNKLLSELRTAKSSKEDLQRRLNICQRTNIELEEKLEKLKKREDLIITDEQEKTKNEVDKIRSESINRITKLENDLNKCQQEKEEKSINLQLLRSKIERSIQNAERYFHQKFNDFDQLIVMLNKPTFLNSPSSLSSSSVGLANSNNNESERSNEIQDFDQINNRNRYKNKMKSIVKEKDHEIDQLNKELKEVKNELKKQKKNFEDKIEQINEENENKNNINKQTIDSLNKKVESLNKKKNSNLSSSNDPNNNDFNNKNQQLDLQRNMNNYNINDSNNNNLENLDYRPNNKNHIQQKEDIDEQLLSKISELTDKLKKCEDMKAQFNKESTEKETLRQKLELDYERVRGELSSLQIIHSECQNEIKSLRNALRTSSEAQNSVNSLSPDSLQRQQQERQMLSFSQQQSLLKLVDSQKNELNELRKKMDTSEKEKTKLEKKVRELERDFADAEKRLSKTQESFDEFCLELQRQPKPSANDFIPPSSFTCPDFVDGTLVKTIEKIALNPSLQPSSKIRNCFKAISSYYESQISNIREMMKEMNDENESIKNNFNKFLIDSSLVLSEEAMTLDEFLNKNGISKMLNEITIMKQRNNFLEHKNSYFRKVFDRFKELFGLKTLSKRSNCNYSEYNDNGNNENNDEELMEQVEKFHHFWSNQVRSHKLKSKQFKILLSNYIELKKESERRDEEMKEENEDLREKYQDFMKKNEAQSKTINKIKDENNKMKEECTKMSESKEEMEMELKAMSENALSVMSNKMKEKEKRLIEELTRTQNDLKEMKCLKEELEKQFDKCKRILEAERNLTHKLENDKIKMEEEMKMLEVKALNCLNEEKKHLKESFDRTFEQLREQSELQRKDISKLMMTLKETEEKCNIMKKENNELSNDKKRIDEEKKIQMEQNDRQIKLMETTMKTKLLKLESEFQQKIDGLISDNEINQRKLYSFVADSFRSYFNPNIQIDEKSFRIVIEKVRQELNRLNDSEVAIRRMLDVRENQTTDDAVAQMLLET